MDGDWTDGKWLVLTWCKSAKRSEARKEESRDAAWALVCPDRRRRTPSPTSSICKERDCYGTILLLLLYSCYYCTNTQSVLTLRICPTSAALGQNGVSWYSTSGCTNLAPFYFISLCGSEHLAAGLSFATSHMNFLFVQTLMIPLSPRQKSWRSAERVETRYRLRVLGRSWHT